MLRTTYSLRTLLILVALAPLPEGPDGPSPDPMPGFMIWLKAEPTGN
jgi:hypothetical protein